METIPEEQLRSQADKYCREHMTNLVTKAKLRIEPKDSFTEWDPIAHRYVFQERFAVWREFDDIEIKVSPTGQILSFYDQNRFELRGQPPKELPSDIDIINIASTTGILGPEATIIQKNFIAGGMVTATVNQPTAWLSQSVKFTINPTTNQVAAFEVTEEALI